MITDEGMAERNGERLAIQYILQKGETALGVLAPERRNYHYHKYIELLYVTRGNVRAYVGDAEYDIGEEEMIIVFPNEPHTFEARMQNCENYVVKLLPDILVSKENTVKEFEYFMNIKSPSHNRIIKVSTEMRELLVSAYKAFNELLYAGELIVRADTIKLCALILSSWQKAGEITLFFGGTRKTGLELLKKLMELTEKKNGCIKTHEAAKFCNFSDGYFIRFFKSVMNMSFTEYTRTIKTKEAERLLKCTDSTITDIAQMLDYATVSHFIKEFKKEKNMSPGRYRSGTKRA